MDVEIALREKLVDLGEELVNGIGHLNVSANEACLDRPTDNMSD